MRKENLSVYILFEHGETLSSVTPEQQRISHKIRKKPQTLQSLENNL